MFRVEVTETAERDVHIILSWLSERSPKGAVTWYQAWEAAIEFLSVNPQAASLAPENRDHEEEIRHWPFKTTQGYRYRALLIVRNQVVYITNVRGTGQQRVTSEELGRSGD